MALTIARHKQLKVDMRYCVENNIARHCSWFLKYEISSVALAIARPKMYKGDMRICENHTLHLP